MILEYTRRKSWPDMAACGEQETQRITLHGGPVRVMYRDDDIVFPKKTNSRSTRVIFAYAAFKVDIPSKRYTTRTGGPRIVCV